MSKVALQAASWYNKTSKIMVLGSACDTPSRANLLRRLAMDILPQKVCTSCNTPYPATRQYFPPAKTNKDGLRGICKLCRNAQNRGYRKNKEVPPEAKAKKAAYQRAYYYNPATHEKLLAYAEERRSRPDIHEKTLEYQKEYRKTYRRPNAKEKHRIHSINRRSRLNAIPGSHTLQESQDQYNRQKGKCYYCGIKIKWGEHHEDHIIPISREGATNDISNIAITCVTCNLAKQDRLPHEFYQGGRLL